MTFEIINLAGDRTLVKGTDQFGTTGKTVMYTEQWGKLKARANTIDAQAEMDAAIRDFYAPLVEAQERIESALVAKTEDPNETMVLNEGVVGVQGEAPEIVRLDFASRVLRLIEEGNTDRLIWVDETTLEILAYEAPAEDAVVDPGFGFDELD